MHNRIVIVCLSQRVDVFFGQFIEIVLLSIHDVDFVDDYVVLSIRSLDDNLSDWNIKKICNNLKRFSNVQLTVCSCQNPTTCPSSCTTIPNLSQFLPIEIACAPAPRLPTNEQHPE